MTYLPGILAVWGIWWISYGLFLVARVRFQTGNLRPNVHRLHRRVLLSLAADAPWASPMFFLVIQSGKILVSRKLAGLTANKARQLKPQTGDQLRRTNLKKTSSSGCFAELEWPEQKDSRTGCVVELSLCPEQWEWHWSSWLLSVVYLYITAIYMCMSNRKNSLSTLAVLDIKKTCSEDSLTFLTVLLKGFLVSLCATHWQLVQWPETTFGCPHHSSSICSYSCCQPDKLQIIYIWPSRQ